MKGNSEEKVTELHLEGSSLMANILHGPRLFLFNGTDAEIPTWPF